MNKIHHNVLKRYTIHSLVDLYYQKKLPNDWSRDQYFSTHVYQKLNWTLNIILPILRFSFRNNYDMDNLNCFTVAALTIRLLNTSYVHIYGYHSLTNRWRSEAWEVTGLKNTQCKMIGYLVFEYLQSFHCIEASDWVLALLNSAELQRYI